MVKNTVRGTYVNINLDILQSLCYYELTVIKKQKYDKTKTNILKKFTFLENYL